jgi:hypothetical protein
VPRHSAPSLALPALLLAACSDLSAPTGPPDAGTSQVRAAALSVGELVRPRLTLTGATDSRTVLSLPLAFPGAANGLGTGSALLITIPGAGTFGCTANFIWSDGSRRYLGAAGHCFIPAERRATHGPGADFDASGVTVDACVSSCDGNFDINQLTGTWVRLGRVAYARQTDGEGNDIGNDFGVVEIPAELHDIVRLTMPVWGGPRHDHPQPRQPRMPLWTRPRRRRALRDQGALRRGWWC